MEKKELTVNKQAIRDLNIWKRCLLVIAILFTLVGLAFFVNAVVELIRCSYNDLLGLALVGLVFIACGFACFSFCATMNALKTITEVAEYKKAMIESEFKFKNIER
ncbi:MAG: hypothetical protein IKS79_06995 [Bacteroidales bacterium]|nr:hypothetical protein [Bacteroidales bacterium]